MGNFCERKDQNEIEISIKSEEAVVNINDEENAPRGRVVLRVERCRDGAALPCYTREGDAGMDVCAAEDIDILPGGTVLVPTGLKFAVPPGYELQMRPRSGISLKTHLRLANSPGTIDSGYRDEVGIIITNIRMPAGADSIKAVKEIIKNARLFPELYLDDPPYDGPCVYKIRKGDRLAQIVLQALPAPQLKEVDSVEGIGFDRRGGLGSTGITNV